MRIISGEYGGRKLKTISGLNTRPTSDKVKESLFHMIGPYFEEGHVLDLYSGSGALGIEAVSRGMDLAYLVDNNYQSVKTINENIEITKQPQKFIVWKEKDGIALERLRQAEETFDLVFLDPPYGKIDLEKTLSKLIGYKLLKEQSIIVFEIDKEDTITLQDDSLELIKDKIYGTTRVIVFEKVTR